MADGTSSAAQAAAAPKAFAALRHPGARIYLVGTAMVMLADSIEHVISYWIIFQEFRSPTLGGLAVITHWLPFLLFSVWSGALADRFDPRRIIQLGVALFMLASLGWAILFMVGGMEKWHAVVLLTIHGLAGVVWSPAVQLLLHDIVGVAQLHSAIRLLATSRTLGFLLGPAIGGAMMLTIGPVAGLFVNIAIYLPLLLWLWKAPYGPKFREGPQHVAQPVRGISDILQTLRNVADNRIVISMIVLAGLASLFIGNAYQAQMPAFAEALGTDRSGLYYSLLLSANAAGALIAGIVLESRGLLQARIQSAFVLTALWAVSLIGFALSGNFIVALALLLVAGFLNLAASSMAQTLVQLHAPPEVRGRIIGLFHMFALGLMTFSGVTVGIGGEFVGVHWSLGLSAAALLAVVLLLLPKVLRAAPALGE